jgi:hypothetical protein
LNPSIDRIVLPDSTLDKKNNTSMAIDRYTTLAKRNNIKIMKNGYQTWRNAKGDPGFVNILRRFSGLRHLPIDIRMNSLHLQFPAKDRENVTSLLKAALPGATLWFMTDGVLLWSGDKYKAWAGGDCVCGCRFCLKWLRRECYFGGGQRYLVRITPQIPITAPNKCIYVGLK